MNYLTCLKILKHINSNTVSLPHLKNRAYLMTHYLLKKPKVLAYPTVLQIELTNRCNLNCIMCPRQGMTRAIGDMPLELFNKIVDQLKGKTEIAILHLLGESLLHPNLFEMIDYCRKIGIRTVLSTNATLLNEQRAQKLLNSKLDILLLSFDGFSQKTYEKIRQGADFNKVVENIKSFLLMKNAPYPFIIVQMIEMKDTQDQIKDFLDFWRDYKVRALVKPFTHWQGDVESIKKLVANPHEVIKSNAICDRLWMWLTVLADGTLIPCCRDYDGKYSMGNLKEQTIQEVWNGEKMIEFRKKYLQGRDKIDICKTCDYNPVVSISVLAKSGLVLFDMFSITRLMYDMEYMVK